MLVVIACAVLYKCMSDEHYAVVAITLVVVVVGRIRGMIEIEGSRGGERLRTEGPSQLAPMPCASAGGARLVSE